MTVREIETLLGFFIKVQSFSKKSIIERALLSKSFVSLVNLFLIFKFSLAAVPKIFQTYFFTFTLIFFNSLIIFFHLNLIHNQINFDAIGVGNASQ
jgi:hypothetical protein